MKVHFFNFIRDRILLVFYFHFLKGFQLILITIFLFFANVLSKKRVFPKIFY